MFCVIDNSDSTRTELVAVGVVETDVGVATGVCWSNALTCTVDGK